jgi:hypothetical protein|tara:strand:+ start:90 stop:1079 length:990 start_codon:yes stop_codon:yes gene_type:complete
MSKILPIGITEGSVMLTDADASFDLDTKFRMIKEAGVFDYIEKTPPPDLEGDYARCSEKYDLPIRAGGWFYSLGRDEGLLEENLKLGGRLGSVVHNTQILAHQADGRPVTNHQVAEIYLRALDWGEQAGCVPTFEVHVNMWSEDFRRISEVADLVEARGVPFRMTLDHSHVIFKIDNPKEQDVFDIRGDVETGVLVLDPFEPTNVCAEWIERGFVWHAHARAAVPNNPVNVWAKHDDGTVGRGIQYPFICPDTGQWHSAWSSERLDSWKVVVRQLMRHHADNNKSNLGQISTEFIPFPDYGGGAKYSIFENSIACARWLRETWSETLAS